MFEVMSVLVIAVSAAIVGFKTAEYKEFVNLTKYEFVSTLVCRLAINCVHYAKECVRYYRKSGNFIIARGREQ